MIRLEQKTVENNHPLSSFYHEYLAYEGRLDT